ncbi:TMEM175 family protein [Microbulbifer hainanensis]|uniref:TMEM175 family protein n=1 Tax=Microbulbifer hainanensis TaxID=2735675 RepID=UPI001865D027|nr:TMEM175 family protein [Microbulbifer hainanensis]
MAKPHKASPSRLSGFSDAVFAVLITVLVLDLHPPQLPTYSAFLVHWPTWLSYIVSYVFIAIVWTNHHYLLRYATVANARLLWFNFAHLFSVSLLPLATAWMAESKLAPQPVSFYAAVFFLVNATYICLIWELIGERNVSLKVLRSMRIRSIVTLCFFGIASIVALKFSVVALGMCICCLILYLKPAPLGM